MPRVAEARRLTKTFMYKHPCRRRNGKAVLAILLVGSLLAFLPLLLRTEAVVPAKTAETSPLIVFGYVYDSTGTLVDGSVVTVTNLDNGKSLDSDPTIGGFYTVTFDVLDWAMGNRIKITATFGDETGENQSVASSNAIQIDLHLNAAIPEIPGTASLLLTVCAIGALIEAFWRWRR